MSSAWKFPDIVVRSGTPARRDLSFFWDDGTERDLSGLTGYFTPYTDGNGTTPLFPAVALAESDATNKRVLHLTADQCTQARSGYYAEIEFRDGTGAVVDDAGWYGMLKIAGR